MVQEKQNTVSFSIFPLHKRSPVDFLPSGPERRELSALSDGDYISEVLCLCLSICYFGINSSQIKMIVNKVFIAAVYLRERVFSQYVPLTPHQLIVSCCKQCSSVMGISLV